MRLRLILSFILIVLVTIGIVVLVVVRQTAQEVRTFMFRGGMTDSEAIVEALEDYYGEHHTWRGAGKVLRDTPINEHRGMWGSRGEQNSTNTTLPKMIHAQLADADGQVLFNNRDNQDKGQLTQNEIRRAIPLEVDGEISGYLFVDGNQFFTQANESSLLSRLNRAALISVIVAGGAAVFLALLLSYSLVRPVRELTKAAGSLAHGDLTQRVPVRGKDDLAVLGRTFNHMAASLQKAENSRRALTADIAHELRTPLAVQLAHLEALEDGIYDLTSENLLPIEEQNHLLTRLVEDLRTLALADAGQLNLEKIRTDIAALVQRVAIRFEPQAGEREIKILQSLDETVPVVLADSQRIEQILNNLLNNALRYSPDQGVIHIKLSLHLDYLQLTIQDNGPGIPTEALPYIFDRFYRADKSRARVGGGTGLGLSIARKIAQAHSGNLTAENHPNGGALFTLEIPIQVS
jgi:signal transduction histidine kinase